MKREKRKSVKIVGLKTKTTNENGQAVNDIGNIWKEFMSKNISQLEEYMINHGRAYGVYFDYEGDYTKPYSFLAGVAVEENTDAPSGLDSVTLPEEEYMRFDTENLPLEQKIGNVWEKIWKSDVARKYTVDYEEYDYTKGPENPEVSVFIGIKE